MPGNLWSFQSYGPCSPARFGFFVHMATNFGSIYWQLWVKKFLSPLISGHVHSQVISQTPRNPWNVGVLGTSGQSFFFRSTYRDVSPKLWKKDWGILYTVKGFYGFAEILLLAIFWGPNRLSLKGPQPPCNSGRKGAWWSGLGPETDLNLPFLILIWGQRPHPKRKQGKESKKCNYPAPLLS